MKLTRRKVMHVAAGIAAWPALPRLAFARDYPTHALHIVVGFTAGGTTDAVARLIGQQLSERLGEPVITENRPGAATNVATELVTRAAPDGYTLLLVSPPATINATLYRNLNFNFVRDIAPVASATRAAFVLLINPVVPANSLPEFIAYARANPQSIIMASPGVGTGPHVCGELLKKMAGISMLHVPYRGAAPAIVDLLAGRVQVLFATPAEILQHVRSGRLRVLAVTTAVRTDALPDTPSISEFFPGYEGSFWSGFGVPKSTPAGTIEGLNREINASLADPHVKAKIADLGAAVFINSPEGFGKFITEEAAKWAKVIEFAGIKPV